MSERRWIILGSDGRHTTVGRHTDPTDDELERAQAALQAAGLGGWLAVMDGDYWAPDRPVSLMECELAPASEHWNEAVAAFDKVRDTNLSKR